MSTRPPHHIPAGPLPAAAGSKPRSSEGCWTCRLRRKKCDEVRPVCQGCGLLEITCHYSDAKPEWMDGGPRQKEMADRVKLEVKRQANYRREKKYLAGLDADGTVSAHLICPEEAARANEGGRASSSDDERDDVSAMTGITPSVAGRSSSFTHQQTGPATGDSAFRMDSVRSTVPVLTPPSSVSCADASPEAEPAATETDLLGFALPDRTNSDANDPNYTDDDNLLLLMTFLDYVFPFMFPFYHPPLFMGGRSWLLPLVRKNKALFHTALSLSSYFFTAVVHSMGPYDFGGGPVCQKASLAELQRHQDLALRELQKDMCKVNQRGVQGFLRESIYVMESILQLLTFDLMIGNTANWQVHLEPASTLFEQILPAPEDWSAALRRLGHPEGRVYDHPEFVPWTSDQAGLRFYAADLLFVDTIASTALVRAPRLMRYHAAMLEAPAHDVDEAVWQNARLGGGHNEPLPSHLVLDLADFFGVMNWAVRLVGEIAALDAWKKERRRVGGLSVTELVARAAQVEAALRGGLDCLDQHFPLPAADGAPSTVEELLAATAGTAGQATHPNEYQLSALKEAIGAGTSGGSDGGPGSGRNGWRHQTAGMADVAAHTRIWAYAALTYLSVVVSGWQPGCPEIASSVARTTELLFRLRDPAALTTLVWPFCVAGCLVPSEQEVLYRALVERMGPLKVFGSTREALGIMEECWGMRERIDEGWDLAAAFSVKGHPALLI